MSDDASMIQTLGTFLGRNENSKPPNVVSEKKHDWYPETTQGFIKGEFIGGGDDIVDLNKRGVLLEKCRLARHQLGEILVTGSICFLRQHKEKTFLVLFQRFEITPRMGTGL